MAKHLIGRTADEDPRIVLTARAEQHDEPRGRLFGQKTVSTEPSALSAVSVIQAIEILERITQRRAERAMLPSAWADRIQTLA